MRRPNRAGLAPGAGALGAGVLVALSMPPWGWWPLAFAGLAVWEWLLHGQRRAVRWRRTWLFLAGWMAPALSWMWFLTAPGYLVAVVLYGSLHATASLAMPGPPDDRWRWLTLPSALTACEALRFCFPFGGVPLASLAISQVAGPFAGLARIGGAILLTFVTAVVGTNVRRVVRPLVSRTRAARRDAARVVAATAALALLVAAGIIAPRGNGTGRSVRVALIQGGGAQGTRAAHTSSRLVVERHLAETEQFTGPTDLVVWPENVIDVANFAASPEHQEVAAQAARLGVAFLVGVTEDAVDPRHFINAQVVVMPDGSVTSRYEKVRRVPFGEYMPLRGLLSALGAPTNAVPRDAMGGHGPAVLDTPVGTVGVMISWEVFFGGRAREAVRYGAEILINPTNGSSYTGTVLQTQQVASSRLRAIETGRWVAQVAPTGFTAFVSPSGHVYDRTAQREATWRERAVELRTGRTWYVALGDKPFVAAAVGLWALPVLVPRGRWLRRRLRSRRAP